MYLWAEGAKLPGLIKDVYDVTGRSELYTDQHINGIEARARDMKESLLKWRRDYAKHSADAPIYREWSDDGDVRVEQYGAGLIMLCSSSRLLGAVCPAERIYQEKEAVKYSGMMRKLVNELIDGNQMASFYLNQKVVVADSVLSTTHLWLQGLEDGQPSEDRLIAGWKFRAWVDGYDDQFSHSGSHAQEILAASRHVLLTLV